MSFAFDETYYLKSKLQQLIKSDAATYGSWSTSDVKDAIEAAGMTVEGHYQQYSLVEGTSGNPYFNTTEYLEAKLAQLKSVDPTQYSTWTVDDVVKAFQDAGFTSAEDHYNQYGCKETDATGHLINPSNAFDANAYVQAKLAQLVAADPETYGEWTAEDVAEAIAEAGMTPVEHFEEYGKAEGQAAGVDMVQTVPVTQRVANDELRDGMNENVPSNYNKPVDAPKDVDASEAGSVDKPCDMATAAKPADPVAVPGDSAYVAVPGGGIEDTNANPVELVTATVTDDKGNVIASESQYGVATTKTENGVTTKTVQPVNSDGTVDAEADPIQTVTTNNSTGAKTTETKLTDSDGNTLEVKEEVVKNDDGTTTTTTAATETDKNDKVVANTETVTEANAAGEVTGSTSTYTDADGKTSTTDSGDTPEPTPEPEPTPTPGGGGSGTPADVTPPAISSMEYDASGDTDGVITVTFSEAVKVVDTVTLKDNVSVPEQKVQSAEISGDKLTVTLQGKAAAGSELTVNIKADTIQDATGNKAGALVSDTYTVPADSSSMHAAVDNNNFLVFEGTAADDTALTIQATDNPGELKLTGTPVKDGGTPTQLETATASAGVDLTMASVPGGVQVEAKTSYTSGYVIKASSLSDVDVKLTSAKDKLTVNGTVANTTVSGTLSDTDAITGTYKLASGLEVTKGSVEYAAGDKKLTISGADGASYSGNLGVVDGLTSLAVDSPGTNNALDLSSVEGIAADKIHNLTLAGGKVILSANQLAALTTVTASAPSTISVEDAVTVNAELLGKAKLTITPGTGSTVKVTSDQDVHSANFNLGEGKPFNNVVFEGAANYTLTVSSEQFGGFGNIKGVSGQTDKVVIDGTTGFTIRDADITANNVTIESGTDGGAVNIEKAVSDISGLTLSQFSTLNLGTGKGPSTESDVKAVKVTISADELDAFKNIGNADDKDTVVLSEAIGKSNAAQTLKGDCVFELSGAGKNYVDLGTSAVTVKAGAAGDTITSGTGADTITLGAGNDTVVFVASNGQDTVSSLAAGDTVNVNALSGGALTAEKAIENTGVNLEDKALYTIALEGDGALNTSSLVGNNAIHTSVTNGHKAIVVVDYTDKTGDADGVYVCAVNATDTTLDASMITTVGVFDAAASVVAAALDGTQMV